MYIYIANVISKYQSIARSKHFSRVFSSCRTNGKNVAENGVPTFDFVYELKNTSDLFKFLREARLVKKILACGKCSIVMKLRSKACTVRFVWTCRNRIDKNKCGVQQSVRYGSLFSPSKLTISEIFLLTYVILLNFPTSLIKSQWFFGLNTMADSRRFINDHVEQSTEAIGGVGKIV
ncbi:uncharacterized protein TNCV_3162341 [Trichonephila clavipes]|nr:uncharacterized protein TNCV_3162341 [Trichonephila clavipes]